MKVISSLLLVLNASAWGEVPPWQAGACERFDLIRLGPEGPRPASPPEVDGIVEDWVPNIPANLRAGIPAATPALPMVGWIWSLEETAYANPSKAVQQRDSLIEMTVCGDDSVAANILKYTPESLERAETILTQELQPLFDGRGGDDWVVNSRAREGLNSSVDSLLLHVRAHRRGALRYPTDCAGRARLRPRPPHQWPLARITPEIVDRLTSSLCSNPSLWTHTQNADKHCQALADVLLCGEDNALALTWAGDLPRARQRLHGEVLPRLDGGSGGDGDDDWIKQEHQREFSDVLNDWVRDLDQAIESGGH